MSVTLLLLLFFFNKDISNINITFLYCIHYLKHTLNMFVLFLLLFIVSLTYKPIFMNSLITQHHMALWGGN